MTHLTYGQPLYKAPPAAAERYAMKGRLPIGEEPQHGPEGDLGVESNLIEDGRANEVACERVIDVRRRWGGKNA